MSYYCARTEPGTLPVRPDKPLFEDLLNVSSAPHSLPGLVLDLLSASVVLSFVPFNPNFIVHIS